MEQTEKLDEQVEKILKHMLYMQNKAENNKNLKYDNDAKFSGFEYAYLFSNEALNNYFNRFKLDNGRVLTVGSSGDQVLYSLLNGAKDVTLVDINPLAKYIFDVKRGIVKTLSFAEVQKYIVEDEDILSVKVYKKIRNNLNEETKYVLDNLYLEGFDNYIHKINKKTNGYGKKCAYLRNEESFNKLKQALNSEYNYTFIESDIQKLNGKLKPDDKYNLILLSNISDYVNAWTDERGSGKSKFFNMVKQLEKHLCDGGQMQLSYSWHERLPKYKFFKEMFGDDIHSIAVSTKEGPIVYRPTQPVLER